MRNIAENGLMQVDKSIESAGTNIAEALDHSRAMESVGFNISQSLIIGFSVLSFGIIAASTLNGITKLHVFHVRNRYGKELKQIDKAISLTKSIEEETKMISYYRVQFFSTTAVVGVVVVGVLSAAFHRFQ